MIHKKYRDFFKGSRDKKAVYLEAFMDPIKKNHVHNGQFTKQAQIGNEARRNEKCSRNSVYETTLTISRTSSK